MSHPRPLPSLDRLQETLAYDPESGVLTWRVATSFRAKVGAVAGYERNTDGYRLIGLDGREHRASRVAWKLMTGADPAAHVDHVDGNTRNNAWSNLRVGDDVLNGQNRKGAHRDSRTGLLGVDWHTQQRRWRARITVDKRHVHLGLFDTAEEAHAAYLAAKRRMHPFNTL